MRYLMHVRDDWKPRFLSLILGTFTPRSLHDCCLECVCTLWLSLGCPVSAPHERNIVSHQQ
jgi:hypothetical protein